jgi:hypothetical protein
MLSLGMQSRIGILLAILILVILIAIALRALLPGGEETTTGQQPGPITPSPPPAATQ